MLNKEFLLEMVCSICEVDPCEVFGKSRKREVVMARQVFGYFARNYLGMKLSAIGRFLGGKDHTTVMHGNGKVKEFLAIGDDLVCNVVERINAEIKAKHEQEILLTVYVPFNVDLFELMENLRENYSCKVIRAEI